MQPRRARGTRRDTKKRLIKMLRESFEFFVPLVVAFPAYGFQSGKRSLPGPVVSFRKPVPSALITAVWPGSSLTMIAVSAPGNVGVAWVGRCLPCRPRSTTPGMPVTDR